MSNVTTIQQTGKDAKLLLLASKVMFWGGLITAFSTGGEGATFDTAMLIVVFAMPVYIIGRIIKWWKYS